MPPIKHFPPPPGVKSPPLSFAARTGDLLYISGIPGFDEKRELPDTFEAQFRNVVVNIKRVLDEAGGTLAATPIEFDSALGAISCQINVQAARSGAVSIRFWYLPRHIEMKRALTACDESTKALCFCTNSCRVASLGFSR